MGFFRGAVREHLPQASLLASSGLLATFGIAGLIGASPHLCLHLPRTSSSSLSESRFLLS